MIDHDVLIQRSYELAPLSPTLVKLAELISDPNADIQAVVKTLSLDPSLAGAVLRQANSARFGGRSEIATVKDAVVRLGPGTILGLATQAGVRQTADRSLPQYGFSEGDFWRHCCAASYAVDALRKQIRSPIPAAASTAALLHDIGKLAMAQFLSADVLKSIWHSRNDAGHSRNEAEREILGVDHAEVGGLIAQHWRLPDLIRLGITHHHEPAAGNHMICDVVHLASCIADRVWPAVENLPQTEANAEALGRLGLTPQQLLAATDQVVAALAGESAS